MSPAPRRRRAPGGTRVIGVDTGGTFTDFAALAPGGLAVFKVPSTPRAPERAVLAGIARAGADPTTRVRHGSTVATNALLERKGARVAFLTTAGFEDLLEIGRQDRPELYALAPRRVPPLVPAARRLGVRERLGPAGERLLAPRRAEIARALAALRRLRPQAVAIGLLHSYVNPAHERTLERALEGLGVPLCRSSSLCPEIREYERFATTVTNAYLVPRVAGYLRALARGTRARVEIVLSHGGATSRGAAGSRAPSRSTSAAPPPTARSWPASCRGAAPGCSPASRSCSRCSTSTPWARAAARSRGWIRAACSTSDRRAPAPGPARRATDTAARPRSQTRW